MPREVKREDFELGSGLLQDFDAKIVDAWFAPPKEEYTKKAETTTSEPFLYIKLESPDLDKPLEQVYSTGAARKWEVARGGKEVISGKDKNIHSFIKTSRAGNLVEFIINGLGGGDKEKGVQVLLSRGYLMTEAEFFIGLKAYWSMVELPVVGSDEKRNVLMPTKVYGFEDSVKDAPVSIISPDELAKLKALASGKTESQLKPLLIKEPGIKDNKTLLNAIFNKGLLKELEERGELFKGEDGKYL